MSNKVEINLWRTAKKKFPISKDTPYELRDKIKNRQKHYVMEGI